MFCCSVFSIVQGEYNLHYHPFCFINIFHTVPTFLELGLYFPVTFLSIYLSLLIKQQ
uniref:Uncharacterized protein n=1 Tax=Anguilla anguilla TaxID=7936 RepID=A0A0E9W6V7_ANGAN